MCVIRGVEGKNIILDIDNYQLKIEQTHNIVNTYE